MEAKFMNICNFICRMLPVKNFVMYLYVLTNYEN